MKSLIRQLSYYNFIHKFQNGETLVWNTYTGSIFLIGPKESIEFEKQTGEWFQENEHYFIDSGVLVNKEEQEKQFEFIMSTRKRAKEEKKVLTLTILPTTACNARCPYCFEKSSKVETMSAECAKNVVSYITNKAQEFEEIYITWFGGEPLLCKDIISGIMNKLRNTCGNKTIRSDIITNGALFDKLTAESAVEEWLVKNVQISLDGTQYNYEKIKNYINIENPYQVVLNNIQNLIDNNINVSIRLNVDKNNWRDMLKLIDELSMRFGEKIQVYVYPIFETVKNKDNIILNSEFATYLGEIFQKLKQAGYREKICEFKEFIPWHCALSLPNNFVIMPSGKLLKCQSEVGQELYLGDVVQGVTNIKRNNEYSKIELEEECVKCCYLPICQGGCLASTKCASKIERCCLEKYYLHDLIEKYYMMEFEE